MFKHFVSFVAVTLVSITLVSPQFILADSDDDAIVSAEEQTDLLVDELLSTISAVTADVTADNADELTLAVSEFMASQNSYRLIGTEQPIGADSDVLDNFERRALRRAYRKGKMTQRVKNGELRTVIPLTFSQSDETAKCAVCHGNYNALVDDPCDIVVVGAAAFRVPLDDDGDDGDDCDDD